MKNKRKRPKAFGVISFTRAISIVIVLWITLGLLPGLLSLYFSRDSTSDDQTMSRVGTFGDSFGFVNSLLTSLSLLTAAYGLIYQQRIRLEEEEASRKQLKKQARMQMLETLLQAKTTMGINILNLIGTNEKTYELAFKDRLSSESYLSSRSKLLGDYYDNKDDIDHLMFLAELFLRRKKKFDKIKKTGRLPPHAGYWWYQDPFGMQQMAEVAEDGVTVRVLGKNGNYRIGDNEFIRWLGPVDPNPIPWRKVDNAEPEDRDEVIVSGDEPSPS